METLRLIALESAKSALMLENIAWCILKEILWTSEKARDTKASPELVLLASDKKTDVADWDATERDELLWC